jgi:hypothetical protein
MMLNPSGTNYIAPEPICNAYWVQGIALVTLASSQGIPGCTLFACPIGSSVLQAVPEADFQSENVPVAEKFNLLLQVPGKLGMNNVGMMIFDLQYGMTLKQALQ